MDCHRVREILFEAAGSDLPEEVRKALEAHLAECRSCAAEASAIQQELEAFRALPRVAAPADFLNRIHERMAEPRTSRSGWKWFSGFFGSRRFVELAGLAVTAMLVVVIYHASLKELPEQKSPIVSAPAPALAPSPAVDSAPAEREPVREEFRRQSPEPKRSAVPRSPAGVAREFKKSDHLTVTLTLRLPAHTAGENLESKAAPPSREALKTQTLRAAPSASRGRVGQDAGGEAGKDEVREAERRREPMPHALHDGKEDLTRSEGFQDENRSNQPHVKRPDSSLIRALADIRQYIVEAGGEIMSTEARQGMKPTEALLVAEIPPETYPALVDRLSHLGETRADDEGLARKAHGTKIRLTLKVTLPEP